MPTLTSSTPDTATMSQPSPARGPHGRIRRWMLRVLAGLTVLALLGVALQVLAEHRDATAHPAPGEHVTLADGRRIHLQVSGEQHDGPTVILEGGAGASTAAWGWIQPAVAEHATVVAYDRAGLGWSEPSPHPTSAETALADLREALDERGIDGPYVLVGHSLGGHYVRAFAAAHPDDVSGIVLLDPSHERAADVLGMSSEQTRPMFTVLRVATRLGLLRLYQPFTEGIEALPQPQRDQALTQMVSNRYARTVAAEIAAVDPIGAALPTGDDVLGDIPLRVLLARGGATSPDEQQQVDDMTDLRRGMAAMSTQGETTVLDDASHVTIVTDRAHAQVVTDTILDVLEQVDLS